MPDDPVEVPADEFSGALWPHPCGDADLAIFGAATHPLLQHCQIAAGECDLG
jgi:hypothetical protein